MTHKKKKKKWMKTRHKVITELARVVMTPYLRLKFGVKVERFAESSLFDRSEPSDSV